MRVIDFFDKSADAAGDRMLVVSDEAHYSYAEARSHSIRLAAAFQAQGLQVNDRVGILAPNVPEALLSMLGVWRAGACWVPLNPRNSIEATIDFMNEVGCQWLILHSSYRDHLEQMREQVPTLEHVIGLDASFDGAVPSEVFLSRGDGRQVTDWGDPFGRPDVECVTWATGGTTGNSKAVVMTNRVWTAVMQLAALHWPRAEDPVNLMVAPITHAAGVMAMVYASLGATVIMRRGFDAADVLDCVERHRVTHMFLPPTAYYGALERQREQPRDCSSLRMLLLGGGPVSPERFGEGVAAFGACMVQSWGQTESPFMLTFLSADEVAEAAAGDRPQRLASCGRATFSSQVAAMDDAGQLLGPNERGELVARGQLVSPGYLGRPADTAEVRRFGWHHTGDVGYLDDDGYVYIVDRKKDMVITGGFNVFSVEVEAAILAMPEVRECAVIGVPDHRWGEAVMAVVVPAVDGWDDADCVIDAARRALGSVKAPKQVTFVESIPRTPVGKVDKKTLRAGFWHGHERAVN
jgi:fatty-acyl-CoA synthase